MTGWAKRKRTGIVCIYSFWL